jgi:hypothetical protein
MPRRCFACLSKESNLLLKLYLVIAAGRPPARRETRGGLELPKRRAGERKARHLRKELFGRS